MERKLPVSGEKYRDFKGKPYQIICLAEHSETGERMVVYQALYGDFSCYVKPLTMFMSEVDHEKYPETSEMQQAAVENTDAEPEADPALLAFLDADSLEEKYNIVVSVQGRITDYLIDSFAVCLDVVIPQGEVGVRYQQLLNSIRTMQKYESTRLR